MRWSRAAWLLAALITAVGIGGCASGGGAGRARDIGQTQRDATSGKPEVLVAGATKKLVMDALTNRMASAGWNVAQANEYQAVYETDAKGAAGFLSGVMYGQATQPVYRLTTQFLETSSGVHVIGNLELVSNPGTPRTTRTEMNSGKPRRQVQELFDAVRDETGRVRLPLPSASDTSATR